MFEAIYYPKQFPPRTLARARTAGGIFRQIFAQHRKEIDSGSITWQRIQIRKEN